MDFHFFPYLFFEIKKWIFPYFFLHKISFIFYQKVFLFEKINKQAISVNFFLMDNAYFDQVRMHDIECLN